MPAAKRDELRGAGAGPRPAVSCDAIASRVRASAKARRGGEVAIVLTTECMSVRLCMFVALLFAPACEKDKPSQPPESSAAPTGVDGLTAACEGGDAKACDELGSAYQFGREGVPENQPLA